MEKPVCATIDADQDGVIASEDCDDNNASSSVRETDADCDSTITAEDCDNTDPDSTVMSNDADCDGLD